MTSHYTAWRKVTAYWALIGVSAGDQLNTQVEEMVDEALFKESTGGGAVDRFSRTPRETIKEVYFFINRRVRDSFSSVLFPRHRAMTLHK